MNKAKVVFSMFLVFGVLMCVFSEGTSAIPPTSQEAVEILKNPSFEEGTVGWEKKGNASCLELLQWHPYEGKSSYGIGNDGGAENAYGEIFQEIQSPGEIKKGDLFIFKVWMKSEDRYSGKASLKLECLDTNDNLLMACQSLIDWQDSAPAGLFVVVPETKSKDLWKAWICLPQCACVPMCRQCMPFKQPLAVIKVLPNLFCREAG